MNLIGLMIARNEDWVIEASVRAALEWVDELVVLNHASTDLTGGLLSEFVMRMSSRVHRLDAFDEDWPEMDHRQVTLSTARRLGATHCAIIDADEIVTVPLRSRVRGWIKRLAPAEAMNLPMIPVWRDLDHYRTDPCVWSRSVVTLAFGDHPDLCWANRDDGYQHHARPPRGIRMASAPVVEKPTDGGVMHLQWASWPRLTAKQALYQMIDLLNWPEREPTDAIRRRYSEAVNESGLARAALPGGWWGRERPHVRPGTLPWQQAAIHRLIDEHGLERFKGLDLFGTERGATRKGPMAQLTDNDLPWPEDFRPRSGDRYCLTMADGGEMEVAICGSCPERWWLESERTFLIADVVSIGRVAEVGEEAPP